MDKSDSEKWLYDNLVCNTRKKNLDDQRDQEMDSQDLMQNTSILYHTESIIELQILGTIAVMIVSKMHGQELQESTFIYTCLLIEHTISYFATIFRQWEIEHHGKLDIHGIMRGPKEAVIK